MERLLSAALPQAEQPPSRSVDVARGNGSGRHIAAVDRTDQVQSVLVVDSVAVDLDASVAQVTRHSVLQFAGLDEYVDQVASEDLRKHLLRAFDIGLEKQSLLKVSRVTGETVRTHMPLSTWRLSSRNASSTS